MLKIQYFIIFTAVLLISPVFALASGLRITEIMYDLEGSDSGREWVEITNIGADTIALDNNWRLCDANDCSSGKHYLKEGVGDLIISPQEIAVLADNPQTFLAEHPGFMGTVIDTVIKLRNDSDVIKLIKKDGENWQNLDTVIYSSAWGANGNGFSLEKIDLVGPNNSSNWQEGQIEGGSPGEASEQRTMNNEQQEAEPSIQEQNSEDQNEETPDLTEENINNPPEPEEYSKDVIINEFLPDPLGSDIEGEWIELYNQGDNQIDISSWQLDDKEGGSNPYAFPAGSFISPKNFLVLSRLTTKIAVNNDADSTRLIYPNGENADMVSFSEKAPEGKSYNRIQIESAEESAGVEPLQIEWRWSEILTPGSANIAEPESSEPDANTQIEDVNNTSEVIDNSESSNTNAETTKTINNAPEDSSQKETGELDKDIPKNQQAAVGQNTPLRYFPILVALALAFGSGFLVFILKKKII